ncbi:glycosyltransferase [Micromonospora sp. NBC_01796]|uniref:glycosyltransferase n=1 Tax=Micromonospora sp. NBC_01796 TaxID=2975987 RepID=UPI002DD82004|nr:glycosyltransferase [Micromonospora sp. NBC_01796]WSA89719.1 glycosyltransferase [Micromonospora sp. NBC_01796]
MRIVRLANFVTPRSGGLRTALRCLGAGYRAAGHEPVLVVPGERAGDEMVGSDRVITLPGPVLPGTGGYRVLAGRRRLRRLLEELEPDRLEVSDRSTLRWTGAWAKAHGVPSLMVSHESLTGLLGVWGAPAPIGQRVADRLNGRSAATYDRVVCTTDWAAAEFRRIGAPNLSQVPLGVDLEGFHPDRHNPAVRAEYAPDGEVLLVHCSRLSPEKRPDLAIDALAALRANGVPATLVVVGDGPRRTALGHRAAGLPVHFTGFLPDRDRVAGLLASADVVVAPGPVETFGLAGLEALACGTPVVVNAASALPEVVGEAGRGADGTGDAFAEAIVSVLATPEPERRATARARAERFGWAASVEGFLRAHDAPVAVSVPA